MGKSLYIENPKEYTRKQKISAQLHVRTSFVSINQQSEKKINKRIPSTISPKRINILKLVVSKKVKDLPIEKY